MNVIFVCINLFELEFRIVFFDFFNPGHNEGLNPFVDNLASVLGRKHNVVITDKDTMGFVAVDSWHQAL